MTKPFSDRTYAAPFGTYQPGGDVGPSNNDVLVGRDGQRAYFIDLLFGMGRRGAFLVTGHRGIGKTSFVRQCLNTHENEVFLRFLNSNVGKAFFWDHIGLAIIGFILLLILGMASQLLGILVESRPSPLACISLIPLAIACFYPTLFSFRLLKAVSPEKPSDHPGSARKIGVAPKLLLFVKATFCLIISGQLFLPLIIPVRVPYYIKKHGLNEAGVDLMWAACFFVALALLFLFEYRFIIQPFLQERLKLANPASCVKGDPPPRALYTLVGLTLYWFSVKETAG